MSEANPAAKTVTPSRPAFAPWTDAGARPLVQFDRVSKRFGSFLAVDGVQLNIYEREFFALLGPSGCGKTTLLRMLAGFESPSEGRIVLDGEDVADMPPHRRPVNMMFQSYALFPHLTVASNIAFGLRQDRMPRAAIAARVKEMLALVKLEGLGDRKPHQMSGGQRQRVALARALAKRPRVLLLDEPLSALDRKLREDTRFELMDLQHRIGLTFIVVTHDQEEAMTVADRIGVMNAGRLAQVATPAEIYEQPNSRWVADFIGDVNLVEGRVVSSGLGQMTVESVAGGSIAIDHPTDVANGTHVWVALRPEKVRLQAQPPADRENCFAGHVVDIGYLGGLSVYKVKLDNGLTMKAAVANRTRMMERAVGWDDRVWLCFGPDAGLVLTQ